jgi:hypothetical protein
VCLRERREKKRERRERKREKQILCNLYKAQSLGPLCLSLPRDHHQLPLLSLLSKELQKHNHLQVVVVHTDSPSSGESEAGGL